ncbi:MAG: glyoxylate/hydroxypyruvate reductase A [Devosiaceae bacterium]|nr:glyoxylate/hydroxypyruvate reductase A [Devosiaceae bacterium MH13]
MSGPDLGKIVLTVGDWSPDGWIEHLRAHVGPDDLIFSDGKQAPPPDICDQVRYAIAWKTPDGFFGNFPNLKAVLSTGAGVDHLATRGDIPQGASIIRVIDPDLTGRVTAWTVMNVIAHHRQALGYLAAQKEAKWRPLPQSSAPDVRVGLMGYGELGQSAGAVLALLGYDCAGWARSPKPDAPINVFAGQAELEPFLRRTDILVCLLPLTEDTRGILNRDTFSKLAQDGITGGPFVINGGRGGHQVEADLLDALTDGTLLGASIDVFDEEPLPSDNPLWGAPNILITPHTAGMSAPEALVAGMVRNLIAFAEGRPVDALVDRSAGY